MGYASRVRRVAFLSLLLICSACTRPEPRFSLENARAHVQMLAGTIGSRPIGTPENLRARQYVVDQLRLFGYDVRVQETDARRLDFGLTAHVSNIIAVKAGREKNAIALLSHYDSVPEAPGAADDGLGVAVSLEAARVLAAREARRHTLFVLVTDGEESGLMGAAGLLTDRDVMNRLQAYINIEATGSGGTSMLFEAGPGNGWIVKPWARSAPHPRGASYAVEIYHRLPNDTDFSILKRRDVPGLNFAAIGDSYPYHTARDTPDRLSDDTLRTTGENTVATAIALDALDLSARSAADQTFFDIGQVAAVSWGPVTAWLIAALSLGCGLLAWFKALGASVRLVGLGRWVLDAVWAVVGVAAVAGASIGGTWLLRAARTVYHPWYAHPERMFLMLLALGILAGWLADPSRRAAAQARAWPAASDPRLEPRASALGRPGRGDRGVCAGSRVPVDASAAGCGHRVARGARDERSGDSRDLRRRARRHRDAVAPRDGGAAAVHGRAPRTHAVRDARVGLRGADAGLRGDGRAAVRRRRGRDEAAAAPVARERRGCSSRWSSPPASHTPRRPTRSTSRSAATSA